MDLDQICSLVVVECGGGRGALSVRSERVFLDGYMQHRMPKNGEIAM